MTRKRGQRCGTDPPPPRMPYHVRLHGRELRRRDARSDCFTLLLWTLVGAGLVWRIAAREYPMHP